MFVIKCTLREIFKISKIRDRNFVAMYLLHFLFKIFDSIFKTVAFRAFHVIPYFGSKIAEHEVTMASFPADLL